MAAFATEWMRELVRPKQASVPWARVVRSGLAVAAPVAIGAIVGELGLGLLAAIGALTGALTDTDGPYRSRATSMVIVVAGGTAGFLLGGLVFRAEIATAALVLAGGFAASVVSVLGGTASRAGLQFIIFLIVGSGADFGPVPAWSPPVCYVIGAAWALALSMAGGVGRRDAPERLAVAEVYRQLAFLMESSGAGAGRVDEARHQLTAAMNDAYDAVITRRALTAGRESQVRVLAALLNAATPAVETTTALTRSGVQVPMPFIAQVRELSSRIRHASEADDLPTAHMVSPQRKHAAELRLLGQELDMACEVMRAGRRHRSRRARSEPARSPVTRALSMGGMTTSVPLAVTGGTAIHSLRDAITSGPATWRPTVRLVLCLAVAEAVALIDPEPRPYWIPMTVAIVLKPDFGSVFARAIQRAGGTIVGVLVGSAILALAPGLVLPIAAIAVFSAMLPLALRRNYGMYATFLTPLIVLLLDLGHGGGGTLVISRLVDTVIGCVIVLLVGYLPWPDTWRSRGRLGVQVSKAVVAVRDYVVSALGEAGEKPVSRQSVRRRAYRAPSDLRTSLQQNLAEPPAISSVAARWWPAVVALERVTDAVTGVVVGIKTGRGRPGRDGVAHVVAALEALATGLEEGKVRAWPEGTADPALAGVMAEVRTAHLVFAGRGA
jgi:uncharacterized membrane protein YccC